MTQDDSHANARPARRPSSRWRLLRRRLLLALGGGLLGLLLAEGALRVLAVSYPLPYVPDPYCGSRLRPGFSAWFTKEGRAYVRINRDGFRDRQHEKRKPPGTLRVAVLGDSFAEAMQVPREQAFWSVLERQLQQCSAVADRSVEVLNFGVSGFSTAQELQMLEHYVWQYDPDVVLLAMFTGNDIGENSKELSGGDAVRPFYVLRDGQLELDQSFRRHPYYLDARTSASQWKCWLINHCRLLQVARQVYARSRQAPRPQHQEPTTELGLDPVYTPPADKRWREAWEITEQLLVTMRDEVSRRGAELWVATLSAGVQVHPDKSYRDSRLAQSDGADLFYPDRRIEQFCRRHEINVVVLAPDLQRYAEQHDVYLHGFPNHELGQGHWNERGHRVAGELLAKHLCQAWKR